MALTACGGDEPVPAGQSPEIKFKGTTTTIHTQSRDDTPPAVVDLPTDNIMRVSALYHHDNRGFFYLKDTEFTYNSGLDCWRCPTSAYYPLAGKVDFVARASEQDVTPNIVSFLPTESMTNIADDLYLGQYKLYYTTEGHMLDGKHDLLVSEAVYDVPSNTTGNVGLNFKHALCGIRLAFKANTQEAENNATISTVDIYNTPLSGILTMSKTQKDANWSIGWNTTGAGIPTRATYTDVGLHPIFDRPGEETYVDFYVPAQDVHPRATHAGDPKPQRFSILIQYYKDDNMSAQKLYADTNFKRGVTRWEPGHRYTYLVEIEMLPRVAINVKYVNDAGDILDDWFVEPEIILDPQ